MQLEIYVPTCSARPYIYLASPPAGSHITCPVDITNAGNVSNNLGLITSSTLEYISQYQLTYIIVLVDI